MRRETAFSLRLTPNAGLAVGPYTGTITVTYNDDATATAEVTIAVNKGTQNTPHVEDGKWHTEAVEYCTWYYDR